MSIQKMKYGFILVWFTPFDHRDITIYNHILVSNKHLTHSTKCYACNLACNEGHQSPHDLRIFFSGSQLTPPLMDIRVSASLTFQYLSFAVSKLWWRWRKEKIFRIKRFLEDPNYGEHECWGALHTWSDTLLCLPLG